MTALLQSMRKTISYPQLVEGNESIISCNGILDCKTVNHSVVGDNLYQSMLLPLLLPFDGDNSHSLIILDNCYIHHVECITLMIQEVGALLPGFQTH